ncbi:TonB-dependent receptor [Sphingopyxis sp. FD7]|uniref:TonB-dependent receptor n=1 Tax=Sphingopyxis sp. FD7 TaxID=1914525 RepID=UPI000DC62007|nr:TonB-dependent receptor [Sphingopyxis sp. FD7]BBB14507.1 TonB-dependent receptor [Sphingopyxis sp. FD7]
MLDRSIRSRRAAAYLLAASALATSVSAVAQDSRSGGGAAGAEEPATVIVVTARGREETLNDVPVVVSVIGEADIARSNATDLVKIAELTPTVIVGAYKSNGGGTIAIRGISSPANQAGFEQAVSVAIDGVQTSDGRVAQLGFFDVSQVEILKGPQALFFGKNSPAGVIAIRTKDPTDSLEVSGRVGYEFVGDEVVADAAVSGPLSDTFGARIAVRYRNLDGWLRNTAQPIANPFYSAATGAPAGAAQLPGTSDPRPGDEEFLGRLTLKGELGDRITARLKVFGATGNDSGPGVATQNIGPCTGPNPRVIGIADPFAECIADNRTTNGDLPTAISSTMAGDRENGRAYGRLRAFVVSAELGFDLADGLTLVSTSGYNKVTYEFLSGLDQTTYSQLAFYNKQRNRTWSQELRLVSDFDSPFNFMIGGFYQDNSLFDTNDVKVRDSFYQASSGRFALYEDLNVQDGTTLSFFGQAIFDISPTVELAGGARYTRERKDYSKRNLYGIFGFNTATTMFPGSDEVGVLKGEFEDSNISPEATLTWRPHGDATIFLAYKTGFKSGGFGLTNPLQTTTRISDVDYESEKARGFELGAKGSFLDRRLSLSAAVFAYEFKDLQVNTFDPARIAFTINNAGKVKQRGFEVEGDFKASDVLRLHAAVAYTRNRFEDFIGQCYAFTFPTGTTRATAVPPPNCSFVNATALTLQQDYGGRAPARSPSWAGNAGFEFDIPVGEFRLGVTGDAFYSGSYFASDTLAPPSLQEDFWRFNASVSFGPDDDRWRASLVGRNLSDENFLLYAADRTGGASVPGQIGEQRAVVSRGREVMLQLAFKF